MKAIVCVKTRSLKISNNKHNASVPRTRAVCSRYFLSPELLTSMESWGDV